jgi:hypothetical protein
MDHVARGVRCEWRRKVPFDGKVRVKSIFHDQDASLYGVFEKPSSALLGYEKTCRVLKIWDQVEELWFFSEDLG